MNRKKFIATSTIAAAAMATGKAHALLPAAGQAKTLTLLHTNDVHSRLDPFPMDGSKYQGMGGVAARKTAIEKFRAEKNLAVLLLDAGDIFQGTAYFNMYKGEPEMKAMSALGYDAGTIGNHDFDGGIDNLAIQLRHANFPIVNCNYDFSGTMLEDKIAPYTIIRRGGWKVGIIGVGIKLDGLVLKEMYGNIVYHEPVKLANHYAHFLKKRKNCDIVICLSHLGYSYPENRLSDRTFAPQTEHIDVIIGGHTHTFLDSPATVNNLAGKPVIINQVGWAGIQLGCLQYSGVDEKNTAFISSAHTGIFLKKTSV